MTTEDRVRRIADAIEATPAAIDLRSAALDLFMAGPLEHIDEIFDLCKDAAAAVLAAHPDLPATNTAPSSTFATSLMPVAQAAPCRSGEDVALVEIPSSRALYPDPDQRRQTVRATGRSESRKPRLARRRGR
jgi:hypothetical protein